MWIARDKDDSLSIFGMKPIKKEEAGIWVRCNSYSVDNFILKVPDCDLYEYEVWWTDEEPTELIIKQ